MAEPMPPPSNASSPRPRLPGGRALGWRWLGRLLLAALLLLPPALPAAGPTSSGPLTADLFHPAPAMAASTPPQPASGSAGQGPGGQTVGGTADERVVVEHLRLRVPAAAVDAWLEAERGSWEPWLAQQPGFLDRQLLWDPARQEGTLLIRWASRAQWQAIPPDEVARVQNRFEVLARQATGIPQGNPFPLVFEGELHPL